jgi:U4/U6 small nuclear ribonucleoprotein PRP3
MASENETAEKRSGRRKRRWGDANTTTAANVGATATTDPVKDKVLALQESIKARLAAAKAAVGTAVTAAAPPPVKRAKHYDLDLAVTAPTYKQPQPTTEGKEKVKEKAVEIKEKKPKNANPYLSHHDDVDDNDESPDHDASVEDTRLSSRTSKPRPRHKALKFTEAGHWQEVAERAREKAAMLEAIGFVSGRKTGHTVKSAGLASASGVDPTESEELPPRADAHPDTKMPICVEWWDMELLPSKIKKQVAALESTAIMRQTKSDLNEVGVAVKAVKQEDDNTEENVEQLDEEQLREWCSQQSSLTYCKTASLIQHIVPVKPPNAYQGPPKEAVLKLTKKELKRQRKLRRQEKQRELQDLQAAGLIPAPEPRLTFRNFIQVLGDQAYLDPSQIERKVQEQIEARQRAHNERNEANKLTKEQRAQKIAWKLQEDTSGGVTVAVFYVKDLSHPYHRAKVDLNAQQNNISGGVLECEVPKIACVICEGGPKAIKRYTRLMLVRMKWTGPNDDDDDDEEEEEVDVKEGDEDNLLKSHKFNPDNECSLVWQGMAVKPAFKGFFFQACETSSQARKVLKTKGVEHYWDQVLQQASGRGDLQIKLDSNSDDDDNPFDQPDQDGDVIMS